MNIDSVISFKNGDRMKVNINCSLSDWSAKVAAQVRESPNSLNNFYLDNGRWVNVGEITFVCLAKEAILAAQD